MTRVAPGAAFRPVQNHGGPMSAHLGLILHVQEGNGSPAGWFDNPTAQASSTWWVAKNGQIEQYVDADLTAWAQAAGNDTYNSVETEGFVGEALTAAQIHALADLYMWGRAVYGWPRWLAEQPGQSGLGWHGMGGTAWGGHTGCPGDVRRAQRTVVLAEVTARSQPGGPPMPPSHANALPAGVKVVSSWGGWAGPDITAGTNELDVFMQCDDGKLYHKWFVPSLGWHGPEVLNDAQ